ncbi:MAG: transcriptional regulator GcvA [Nitratireductor sp.]
MTKQKLPPLTWLRAFEASARFLSFTSAAEELHLTQAAISKQVKLLEQYLREPLFHRKPRSLVLTKVGAAYLPKVNDAFARLAAGTEEVFGHRRSEILTIRSAVGFSVNWLAPRLPGFLEQHPGVMVRVVTSVWNEEFDREHFDLDIRYGTGKWPGFNSDQLSWETLSPVCSPRLLDGDNALRLPADVGSHLLLHVMGYEEGWANWLKLAGVTDVNAGHGLHFDTSLLAFEVAATGAGIALGRTSMVQKELSSGRLVAPFALELPIAEAFHLISPSIGSNHPHAPLFRNWIVAEAAKVKPQNLDLSASLAHLVD